MTNVINYNYLQGSSGLLSACSEYKWILKKKILWNVYGNVSIKNWSKNS